MTVGGPPKSSQNQSLKIGVCASPATLSVDGLPRGCACAVMRCDVMIIDHPSINRQSVPRGARKGQWVPELSTPPVESLAGTLLQGPWSGLGSGLGAALQAPRWLEAGSLARSPSCSSISMSWQNSPSNFGSARPAYSATVGFDWPWGPGVLRSWILEGFADNTSGPKMLTAASLSTAVVVTVASRPRVA